MDYNKKLNAQEAWLRRLNIYWSKRTSPRFFTRIGEIYEVDFGMNVGTEFSGRHLAICLSDTNPSQERMLVIPLTSQVDNYNVALEDIISTPANHVDCTITGGVALSEATWISKHRIFRTSLILSEPETVTNPVKGMVKVSAKQLKRWKEL